MSRPRLIASLEKEMDKWIGREADGGHLPGDIWWPDNLAELMATAAACIIEAVAEAQIIQRREEPEVQP